MTTTKKQTSETGGEGRDKRYAPPVEGYLPLYEAVKLWPVKIAKGSMWRWAQTGVMVGHTRRIRLQTRTFGGRLYTRKDWIDEFVACVQAATDAERNKKIAELQALPDHDEAMRQINGKEVRR